MHRLQEESSASHCIRTENLQLLQSTLTANPGNCLAVQPRCLLSTQQLTATTTIHPLHITPGASTSPGSPSTAIQKSRGGRGAVSPPPRCSCPTGFLSCLTLLLFPCNPPVGILGHVRKRLRSATITLEQPQSSANAEKHSVPSFMNE